MSEFVVEGNSKKPSQVENFHGFGDLKMSYLENGKFTIDGKLNAAWVDGRLLNPTRWRMLPTEIKAAFITILLAVIGLLIKLVMLFLKYWQENRYFNWIK